MRALYGLTAVTTTLVAVIRRFRGYTPERVQPPRAPRDAVMGLRTMSSIAWFPLAILLFQLTETAILARDAVWMRLSRGGRRINA